MLQMPSSDYSRVMNPANNPKRKPSYSEWATRSQLSAFVETLGCGVQASSLLRPLRREDQVTWHRFRRQKDLYLQQKAKTRLQATG